MMYTKYSFVSESVWHAIHTCIPNEQQKGGQIFFTPEKFNRKPMPTHVFVHFIDGNSFFFIFKNESSAKMSSLFK